MLGHETQDLEIEQSGSKVTTRFGMTQVRREQARQAVVECLEAMRYQGAREFVFDLEQVTFISSGAVGVLVELLHEIEPTRGRIALIHCSDQIIALFQITKLDHIFEITA